MNTKIFLGKKVKIIIDRPLGSIHPKFPNIQYEVNYGYVPQTLSGDGEEFDAYILGVNSPLESFEGVCIAIIKRKDEADDKLIVAPCGVNFDNEEIVRLINFQEKYFESEILRK